MVHLIEQGDQCGVLLVEGSLVHLNAADKQSEDCNEKQFLHVILFFCKITYKNSDIKVLFLNCICVFIVKYDLWR